MVDVDSAELAAELEARFPEELKGAAVVQTKNGRHYYFTRSALADADGYYDGAAQVVNFLCFVLLCLLCVAADTATNNATARKKPKKNEKNRSRRASTSRRAP